MKLQIKTHLRIIWTIAAKDIIDAIRNKTILGIMIGVAILILSSQALPLLMKVNDEPRAFFYDPGKSSRMREIVRTREIKLNPVNSYQDLKNIVGSSSVPILGLLIPSDFDEAIQNKTPIYLDGYCIHWAKPSEVEALVTHFENKLSLMTGFTIHIHLSDQKGYPSIDDPGFAIMNIGGMITGVLTMGLILVPLLISEEIENHTMEALMISPARTWHMLIGKSIAGINYSLIAAIVMLIFTHQWIVHWGVLIPGVVLGALSAVSLGLFFGSISKDQTTINLLVGVALVILLIPSILWQTIQNNLDLNVITLIQVLPSIAMSNLIFTSFLETFKFQDIWPNIAILLVFIIATLCLAHWIIKRMDR